MTLSTSWPGPTGVTDSIEARRALAPLLVRDTSGNARAGVFPRSSSPAAIVSARSDMQLDVAAFEGVSVRGGGPLFMANDGVVQVTIDAAPGANQRTDIIYFKQNETMSPFSEANDNAIFGVVKGTAGPGAVGDDAALNLIAGAVELARIVLPSTATATNSVGVVITQTAKFTALAGTPFLVRTSADLTTPNLSGYPTGTEARAIDTGIVWRYNGTAWKAWRSDWINYTPTVANVAVGTGGSAASAFAYKYVQGDVRVRGGLVLGSSGASVSGIPTITLPVNRIALVHPFEPVPGALTLYDTSDSRPYSGALAADNANVDKVRLIPTNSGSVTTSIGSTSPFTWAAGDGISVDFTYRPA